jgi:hypothetical protein
MSRLRAIIAVLGVAPLLALGGQAAAQSSSLGNQLLGSWSFVSVVGERDDGSRSEPFGADPKGIIIFAPDGAFSLFQSRSEVPRIASNDRATATAEEARGVIAASIAYFGTWSVDEATRSIALRLQGSTYTNLLSAPTQTRLITQLTADELHFTNPRTPSGVTLRTVWRRMKPS